MFVVSGKRKLMAMLLEDSEEEEEGEGDDPLSFPNPWAFPKWAHAQQAAQAAAELYVPAWLRRRTEKRNSQKQQLQQQQQQIDALTQVLQQQQIRQPGASASSSSMPAGVLPVGPVLMGPVKSTGSSLTPPWEQMRQASREVLRKTFHEHRVALSKGIFSFDFDC